MATYIKNACLIFKDKSGNLYFIRPQASADNLVGTVPVGSGGTGAADAATARSNLGAAAASHNHDASNINAGTMPIARGGTGGGDAATARSNLGAAAKTTQTTVTILATKWQGSAAPYTAEVDVAGLAADPIGGVALASNATPAQREACRNAMLSPVTPGTAGKLKLVADGDKPLIDLPVVITLWG